MNGTAPSQGAGGSGGGSWGAAGGGAGAGAGASGGRSTLDQILFMGLGSSPQRMTVSIPCTCSYHRLTCFSVVDCYGSRGCRIGCGYDPHGYRSIL